MSGEWVSLRGRAAVGFRSGFGFGSQENVPDAPVEAVVDLTLYTRTSADEEREEHTFMLRAENARQVGQALIENADLAEQSMEQQ